MPAHFVCDMDGVIYHGSRLIPGALDFVKRLQAGGHRFLFLTNNSQWTPRDLKHKLEQMGISVDESAFHTSALATAEFLSRQQPGGTAYVIGGAGLTHALYSVGFTLTEHDPDYVVVGETRSYDYEKIERAVRLILKGARFIATNPDLTGPSETGITPACGALVSPIELATGRRPYFVGKPNPLMMWTALHSLQASPDETFMVGDRMDTDIIAGTEAGMRTILVLSGVTTSSMLDLYPYRPSFVYEDVGHIPVDKLTLD
jgi:NagD protein